MKINGIGRPVLPVFWYAFLLVGPALAQPLTAPQIDALVQRTLTTFDVPGIAVAVIKDGKVIHAKGYGVRSLKTRQPVDENTLFGIASNSKAFTAAALGMLVDAGKLTWDDKVIAHIPEFQLYNAYVTAEFTIRDLLTHRSGLGLGAGDLMFWPDSGNFTIKDIIHNLRYLKPVSGFRTKFDYDNLLYMVAGEVVERVSDQPWEAFVEERIMKPLQMNRSAGSYQRLADKVNVIDAHAPVNNKVQVISRQIFQAGNSAGGIYASVADMSQWAIAQLNQGKYGDTGSRQLFTGKTHAEMWSPQTILPVGSPPVPPYNTHFDAYGLGWFLCDEKGYKKVSHGGFVSGMVTDIDLFPELSLGIIVLTNQQVGAALRAITNTIKDGYMGIAPTDWVSINSERIKKRQAKADSVTKAVLTTIASVQRNNTTSVSMAPYLGTYRDNWFGDVVLSQQGGKTEFRSVRSPRLLGEVFPYKDNTLLVKWYDRSFDADAYLTFAMDGNRQPTSIMMKPISPLTDFSYDFQDLNLQRVKPD